jgi:hypothetical protein
MAGRGDPPEGLPGGGDDEYRSVVFDESFVRAARLKEYSAKERMADHAHAVRVLPPSSVRGLRRGAKQFIMLILVVAIAFGSAIYLGTRQPYRPPADAAASQLRTTVVQLSPQGKVPGGTPGDLFTHSPAAQFLTGAAGIELPDGRQTRNFSDSQVMAALITAKDYLVASSLDPEVLAGRTVQPARMLIDPEQLGQFDHSLNAPADDGRNVPAGWLVRFDSGKVLLADPGVRVHGTFRVEETGPDALQVTADHTFVYAVRPAGPATGPGPEASLFTVRRELSFRFDRGDLQMHRVELLISDVQAGPQACSAEVPRTLRPLLAGQRAAGGGPGATTTDPFATGGTTASLCGTLAPSAQPHPAG